MPAGPTPAVETPLRFDGADIGRLRLFAANQTYLYARSSCDPASEVSCARGTPLGMTGGSVLETNISTDARRLFLFVDGASRSDQGYALFVEP